MNFNINNLPEGAVQGCVSGDEIERMSAKLKAEGKTGIVYDPDAGISDDPNINPIEHLADVNDVLGGVEKILEYMCNDEVIALKEKDDTEYKSHMEEKFPAFCDRYYTLFQTIIEGEEDLTHLFSMLGAIERIKKGEVSMADAEIELGKELAKDYLHEGSETTNKKKKKKKNRNKNK